jgi:ribosome-associated protein
LRLIEKTLDDGKAEAIAVIDLENKSAIADYMVIASGRSQRQIVALAERLLDALREAGHRRISVEGMQHGEWVLVDAGDVIVHLFRPEQRAHYNLEKMWGESFADLDESIA